MQNRTKSQAFPPKSPAGLFGNFVAGPFEQERAQYPLPSRMSQSFLARLKTSALTTSTYPKGATLFEEGQKSCGFYVILEGRAKVFFMDAARDKSLILGFFGPGTTLGLEAALLGHEHISTAEIVTPAKVAFVNRADLLEHVSADAMAALELARMMGEAWYFAVGKMRALDLAPSAEERLARFLLELGADSSAAGNFVMLDISQAALAQMLGLARETVTRLISSLKRRGILQWKRSGMIVQDWQSLEMLARSPDGARTSKRASPGEHSSRTHNLRAAVHI